MKTKSNLIGIEVLIKGTSSRGVVQEVQEQKGTCTLEVNGKILKVSISDIKITEVKKNKKKEKSPKRSTSSTVSGKESLSIDLHGKTRAEANELLLSLLDKALLQGVQKLEIIHGHGNGIIKKEVHTFLDQSPYIASYKLQENNSGTTIAFLM